MSIHNPLISVLMPVYNGEKFLREAIDSILNQSYRNFEFIIINDGSTDETENIIFSYNDNRIRYIKNESNLRLIKTLNYGIELAKGEYIARMDADDIAVTDRFEKQIKQFILHDEIDMVNCQCLLLNEDGNGYRKNRTNITVNYEAIKYVSIFQTMIVHPAVMIKTSIMKRFKYNDQINTEHVEDFELWNRLFENNIKCFTIPESLIFYRLNSESITNTNGREQQERIKRITISILKKYDTIIDDKVLNLILGDSENCSFKLFKKADSAISNFFLKIRNEKLVSKIGYNDMILWKNSKILFISFKSLRRNGLFNSFGVVLFLITKMFSLVNIKLVNKLK
ncbi:glycosyltransferase [Flavobacterium sp. LHD-85]|uniref:glycosyltransferase family 2 protein n=1 Tax=Flavobacterium sp. LHD-85 TaxID=3071410 RepID=UPI0027E1B3BA|nr:glycosyltransferase [Flavobacterium sp. LHD-85]MDQ6531540.1 glycosyltransferase [Flavobacterium sp. LHD-85]